jgi:cytochrome c-type biogenesis protein CcmE
MTLVLGILAGVSIAGALALSAFRQNVTFFFDPSQVAAGQVPAGERFRLGGMVTEGSVKRAPGSLEVRFVVTDFKHDVPVIYNRVLPDLFREGTGVVAHGRLRGDGTFVADEVLAKHDEKYMPPEVARSLKRRHGESRAAPVEGPAVQTSAAPAQKGS